MSPKELLTTIYLFPDVAKINRGERVAVARRAQPPHQVPRGAVKVGRNVACPCGSGKKFKHCCIHTGVKK